MCWEDKIIPSTFVARLLTYKSIYKKSSSEISNINITWFRSRNLVSNHLSLVHYNWSLRSTFILLPTLLLPPQQPLFVFPMFTRFVRSIKSRLPPSTRSAAFSKWSHFLTAKANASFTLWLAFADVSMNDVMWFSLHQEKTSSL